MSVPTRRRAVRTTSWALVLTALLLVPAAGVGTTYLTLLGIAGCVAAMVAAAQVRNDDVLGWLTAVAASAPVALLLWVAHVHGLPGHRTSAWGPAQIGAAGLSVSVVVLAVTCAVLPTAGSSGRSGSAGTLRP